MKVPPLGFRARLLLALVGLVGVLLGVTLVVVRAQTQRQVEGVVARTLERSRDAFARQERARQGELQRYAGRFAGSNRLPAALAEVVDTAGVGFLLETTRYELQLAGIPGALAAFTGADGRPLGAVLGGRALADAASAVPAPLVARTLERGAGAFGYHLAGGRLFGVHAVPLALFGTPVGALTVGFPVDAAVARELGESVGAEVCFVAGGRCVASTAGVDGALGREMVRMAGARAPRRVRMGGEVRVLLAERVAAGEGMRDVWRVTAVPLGEVLAPFAAVQRATWLAGAGALALAVVLGLVLSRSFAGPVRALAAATERIARGDYEARVQVRGRDELGALARAFNEMARGLMLKERYRGVLDKVVSREIAEELLKGDLALGGETRRVTTLFADLRGFTTLTERMEPARAMAMLNEFLARATAAIEAEGGVVDKYAGDEVMAVFGAPLALEDDAGRAVRAACAIRAAVDALNAERAARGEPPLAVGIGINTGPAVAGNLGTPGRLSYTVVGQSVNVAARLCSLAEAGEILVSAAIYNEVRARVEATHCGPQMLKGLTAPIEVHAIDGLLATPSADASPSSDAADSRSASEVSPSAESPASSDAVKAVGGVATAIALMLSAALAAGPAGAQNLPTLEELGIGWTSADGTWQVTPGGRIDVEGFFPQSAPVGLIFETEPFVAPRVSVFVDVLAGRRVYGSLELRADRGEAPSSGGIETRVEQAFVRLIPFPGRDFHLQLGRFVSPFGAYPQRHHSPADAFLRPPLSYDYRTMVSAADLPGGPDGFIAWKDAPEEYRPIGAPVVWAAPYQVGAMAAGGWKGFSARVAVMNSAPSSEPREWNAVDTEHGPSLVGHVGAQVTPELRVGASYNTGSYVWDEPAGAPFPAGRDAGDYAQEIWGFEASFARGPVEARGELFLDRWEVPNVADDARDVSYYVESRLKLSPGLFAAARYGALRFNEIRGSDGVRRAWDYDVDRLQLAAGYRLARTTEVRAEYLATFTAAPPEARDDLLAVRWTYVF